MHDGAWVLPLSDPLCADATLTGGKAAVLAELTREGLPVPDAYVLPVAVFHAHCPDATPEAKPERPEIGEPLADALRRIAAELCPAKGDRLAVRSSALAEDGAGASFAGQHATYYYVDAETLAKTVVDCWLSLWSDEAVAYRAAQRGERPFGMAVIIQRMIQSERSGVCFTRDPVGGDPSMALLEATWGLGAALVDGRVSPDRFWVDQAGAVTDRKISRKRLKVGEDLRDPAGQRLEPVPLALQTRPSLTDIEVGQIAGMARQLAEKFGAPQDVEWAIDGDELFVLQSRPITTAGPIPTPAVEGRWVLFKPTAENFSEPFSPMTVDLLRRVLPPFGRFIHGRYYVNADLMARLLPWRLDDEGLADLLLLRGVPETARLTWVGLARVTAMLCAGYLLGGAGWHRTARVPLETLTAFEARCRSAIENVDLDPLGTLRNLILNDHPFRPIGENPVQANVSSVRYFVLIEMLGGLLTRIAPEFDHTKLSLLVSGGEAMLSQQMVEGIRELARTARDDAAFAEAMTAGDADLQALVLKLGEDHPFTVALETFMRRFGHRAVRELDLAAPRWREDNTTVLAMVRNYLRSEPYGDDPAAPKADAYGLRLAAEDELHQAIPRRWQRRLVDHLIERIRYFVTLRENTRHYHTMALATVRLKLKQLEQQLLQAERLRCEDDIFFLEYAEALALQAGALDWLDVEPRIRERRLLHQQRSQEQPAETLNLATRIPVLTPEKNVLVGDCACPGVATGTARVIRDPTVAADLDPGDILIAPYTDPAWTPLFPGAGAIIVEVGSYLSHAGTVAREYQVPCLVDVHDCTRRIRSGDRLRVNATEGWVEILT